MVLVAFVAFALLGILPLWLYRANHLHRARTDGKRGRCRSDDVSVKLYDRRRITSHFYPPACNVRNAGFINVRPDWEFGEHFNDYSDLR